MTSIDRRNMFKAAAAGAFLSAPALAASAGEPDRQTGAVPASKSAAGSPKASSGNLSAERLERMRANLMGHVERGDLPGFVALVHRNGETHVLTGGRQALGGTPMRRDTIFRIASITKPITAAAAMMLVEEGVLRLDDPVDGLLPELANRQVLRSLQSDLADTVPANRPITLRDLLTLRFGLGAIMVWPSAYPIQFAMEERGVAPGADLFDGSPDEYMKRLGELPLAHQPGDGWLYDTGMHVAGILLSRATGRSLGDLLRERIFDRLGMKDTGFFVPADKLNRFATFYHKDHQLNRLIVREEPAGGRFSSQPDFESGSGGLVSTADDYLAFSRMMLAGGIYEGRRLLSRPAVALMTRDHLSEQQKSSPHGAMFFNGNRGWGFGMAVDLRRDEIEMSPGRFGWDGGYGTSAYADPAEDLIGILMTQRMMDSPTMPLHFRDFWTSAYAAIDD